MGNGGMIRYLFQKILGTDEEDVDQLKMSDEHKQSDRSFLFNKGYMLLQGSLGEGTFSKVKRAFSKYHENDVAVKIVDRDHAAKDFLERFLPRELDLILKLKHKNICKYHDIMENQNKVYIIMEYAPNGDLLEYILEYKFIEENLARYIFRQIAVGLKYLHQCNILHRDLKCENILLSKEYKVMISDFGFAKTVQDINCLNQTYCGSSAYAPIEILNGMPYDGCSADVWSLGCILYIMTTGTMPFDDTNKAAQIAHMRKGPSFTRTKQKLSLDIQILISGILNTDVTERLTLSGVQNNKWYLKSKQVKFPSQSNNELGGSSSNDNEMMHTSTNDGISNRNEESRNFVNDLGVP